MIICSLGTWKERLHVIILVHMLNTHGTKKNTIKTMQTEGHNQELIHTHTQPIAAMFAEAFMLSGFSYGWFLPGGQWTSEQGHQMGKINDFTCCEADHIWLVSEGQGVRLCAFAMYSIYSNARLQQCAQQTALISKQEVKCLSWSKWADRFIIDG